MNPRILDTTGSAYGVCVTNDSHGEKLLQLRNDDAPVDTPGYRY